MRQTQLPRAILLAVLCLIPLALGNTTSPIFTTTVPGSYEAGSVVLSVLSPTISGSFSSQTTTITYSNYYFQTPSFGYGINFLNSNWAQTTSTTQTIVDVSSASSSTTSQTLRLNFTTGSIISCRVTYVVCLSNFFFLNVQTSYQDLSSISNIFTANQAVSRTTTLTLPYKTKSNSSNAVVAYTTAGLSMMRQSNTFEYTLTTNTYSTSTFTVTLTCMANNGMRFIRVVIFNYESIVASVDPPYYVDMGFTNSLSGSVSDSSGLGLTTTGTILTGITDFAASDANAILNYNFTLSTLSYTIISTAITRTKTAYIWYRMKTCPIYYFESGSFCQSCDYTCTTCSAANNVSCLSCQASSHRTLTSSSCPCNNNFRDVSNRICQQILCPSYCTSCSSDNFCTGCISSTARTLTNGSCICTQYGIEMIGQTNCLPCYPACLTCSAPISSTACLTCNLDRDHRSYLDSNHSCNCISGYYQDPALLANQYTYSFLGAPCLTCHHSCATCTSPSACASCNATLRRQINSTSGLCACMVNYYDDGLQQTCLPCHHSCLTCSQTNVCISCPSTRTISGNNCPCDNGYYDAGVATCQPCHYSCYTCTNSSACSSCNITYFRTMGTNFCTCIDKYYDITNTTTCGVCDTTCATCSDAGASNCLSCSSNNGRQLTANKTSCVCSLGYYEQTPVVAACNTCSYSCMGCSTSSTACDSCNASMYRAISGTNCLCMDKYYDDGGNELCVSCNHFCLTCTNSSECTSCDNNTRNISDLAACDCLIGYYDDGVSSSCQGCLSTCLTCTNPFNCSSCPTLRYMASSQLCMCTARRFQPNCQSCHYSCLSCVTTANQCQTCNGSAFRQFNSSAQTCQCYTSYYDDGSNQLCLKCQYSCATCTNDSACVSCPTNRQLNSSTGFCDCLPSFYQNSLNLNCLSCHYSCATCSEFSICTSCNNSIARIASNSSTICVCNTGFYDMGSNQICYACDIQCHTCSSYSVCTSCLSSNHRTFSNKSCPCDIGYYHNNTSMCEACHYSCLTCTSGTACLTCDITKNRTYTTGPYCSCQIGMYDVTGTTQCSPCDYTCLTCQTTSTHCLTCPTSRTHNNASYTCPCTDGFYDSGSVTCLSCHYTCATCANSSSCLSCGSTRQLDAIYQCVCKGGYYQIANQSACAACQQSCSQCSDYSTCTVCDTSVTYRELSNSSCICTAGYYDAAPINYTCQLCQYSCQSCNVVNQCASCNIAYKRTYNSSSLLCSCTTSYYDDGSNQPCLPCPYDCLTCSDANTCLTCTTARSLSNVTNRCMCTISFYQNGTYCQSCPVQCTTCNSSSVCTGCAGVRLLSNDACVCPTKTYAVAGSATCSSCHYSCATCVSSTQCSSCNATLARYLTSTYCLCMATYYDDLTDNQTCLSCHYSCKLCNASSVCLSCDSTKNRVYNSISKLCECASGYFEDNNTQLCVKCSFSCLTCSGSSTTCTDCNPTYNRVLNNTAYTCDCPDLYYYDTMVSVVCAACDYTCLSCVTTQTTCTSCLNTTYRTLSGTTCPCSSGFYSMSGQATCQNCSYACVTCVGTESNCTLCSSANYRSTTPNCGCIDGYYDGGSAVCSTCNYTCQTCTNGLTCSTCNLTAHYRSQNSITLLCDCITQYYDAGSAICQQCSYSCLTCQHPTLCVSCPSTRSLTNSTCPCLPKYYDDSSSLQCLDCNYTCQTCFNTSVCSSCNAAMFRQFNSSTFYCSCMAKYYDAGVQLCISCHASCATCINGTACQSCPLNINKTLNSTSGSQYCVCLYGHYENVTAGVALGYNSVCNSCLFSCQTCDLISTNCTLCNSTAFRYMNDSSCLCMSQYFQLSGQMECLPCFTNCLTCTSTLANNCLSCDNSTYLLNNTCYAVCPSSYLNVTSPSRICTPCTTNCLSCPTSVDVCQSCASPYFIFSYNSSLTVCIDACPATYYQVNQTCLACQSPCFNCTALYTCTSCISQYYINSAFCYPCENTCLTCTGSTAMDCSSCISNYMMLNGLCQKLLCTDTQYVHSTNGCQECTSAFPNSLTCLSTGPQTCKAGYLLSNNSCVTCVSVTGYVYDATTNSCKDYCGDGIILTSLCDDGNNLNGDGCSSVCTIENGWSCPNNLCTLTSTPVLSLQSIKNYPANHSIVMVVQLTVGLRLTKANFILKFTSLTNFQYFVYQLNSQYSRYMLVLVYFENAYNQQMSISVKSPASSARLLKGYSGNRLMQTSTNLNISLSLSLNLNVETRPPAVYVTNSQAKIYTQYLRYLLAVLHILIIVAVVVVLIMKLKVMLLITDAFNAITMLYIISGLNFYGSSLLSHQASFGLQPFPYPFGSSLTDSSTNFYYFDYRSNIFSSCPIQLIAIILCLAVSMLRIGDKDDPENVWYYYRTGFVFAFAYELILGATCNFIWSEYESYLTAYSWMASILVFIWLLIEGLGYYRGMEVAVTAKRVVPAVSFITNDIQQIDRTKTDAIFEIDQDISKQRKMSNKMEYEKQSDEKTQQLEGGLEIAGEQSVKYYDLMPSDQSHYSLLHSNHINRAHLPLLSVFFPILLAFLVSIQSPTIRTGFVFGATLLYFILLIVTKNETIKAIRMIKLFILSLAYILISLIGLAISVGYTSTDLKTVDSVVVSIVLVAVVFNLIMFVVNVYKSEAYREYQINKKNKEIMQRNKRQNESRQKIYNRADVTLNSKLRNNISEPSSQIQIHYQPQHEIQISQEPAQEKQLKISNLKKHKKQLIDSRTMVNQIDDEVSDVREENADYRREFLDDKNIFDNSRVSVKGEPGSRMRNINQSQLSMFRLGDTPIPEEVIKERRKGRKKSQEKEQISPTVHKKKTKKKHPKQQEKLSPEQVESSYRLEDMLSEMEMPRGFKLEQKTQGRQAPRLLEMDEISSIREERQQFMEQNMSGQMSVFNKILQDYQKYRNKKGSKKKA